MSDAVLTAVIGGVCSMVVGIASAVIAAKSTGSDVRKKMEIEQAVTNTKLDELTREVREHNGFARRMPVVEEQLRVANHRIADLEKQADRAVS